jgi:hypothetical protein
MGQQWDQTPINSLERNYRRAAVAVLSQWLLQMHSTVYLLLEGVLRGWPPYRPR